MQELTTTNTIEIVAGLEVWNIISILLVVFILFLIFEILNKLFSYICAKLPFKKKSMNFISRIITFVSYVICWYLFLNYVIIISVVPTGSMAPTICPGDFLISNAVSYVVKSPERGDIVLFDGENSKGYVKRVIGIPGDEISFSDGYVLINGAVAIEDYTNKEAATYCTETFTVPKGHYFVMGDNRLNSQDSRFFNQPYIAKSQILGQVLFVLPTSKVDVIREIFAEKG